MPYQHLPGDGEVGIVATGPTPPAVFESAAFAMFDVAFDLADVPPRHSRPVVAMGDTLEELVWHWLDELLAMSRHESIVPASFVVDRLEEGGVQGSAAGLPLGSVPPRRVEVVRVDRRDITVVEVPDGWWLRVWVETRPRRPGAV